ncbi:serine hydrolase domain-containing protein [Glycomyces sp. NPDC021274]|uniref:serine hydrolase domain-containing protein n=1 Tax=Glycomyces sp. NPDC021274 TaxID=3155120 RepID=UPI0033C4A6CB
MVSIGQVRDDLHFNLPRLVLEHGVPGASVAVGVGDAVVEAASGVVNTRTRVPVAPDSVFQIQSITKVWTATLIMQLFDEGLVALDDSVRAHLPEFRTADPDSSASITIRHLLTHTGGFEGDLWKATTTGDDALQRLVEDCVPELPQSEAPGTRYSYCSAGMAVLGRIVEIKRRMPFAAAVRSYLAVPLGLEEIAFNADEALGFSTAMGHLPQGDRGMRPLPVWATFPESNAPAGSHLAMSARALLAFGRMHLADGLAPDGTRVLTEASAKAMRSPETGIPASGPDPRHIGLVWELGHGGTIVGHAGGTFGIASLLMLLPAQGVSIALLTNGGDFNGLFRDLVDPWIQAAAGVSTAPSTPAPDSGGPGADAARYIGDYGTRNQLSTVSIGDDGRLELSYTATCEGAERFAKAGIPPGPFTSEIRRVEGDLFASVGPGETIGGYTEFLDSDEAGRARFMHTGGRSIPRLP